MLTKTQLAFDCEELPWNLLPAYTHIHALTHTTSHSNSTFLLLSLGKFEV